MEKEGKNAINACDSGWVTTMLGVERSGKLRGKCGEICNIQGAGSRASC
jgi:hypothetical protein